MCYFESHWWPPALNQDGLLYSPDGWSRVYNGEMVYLLYGKMGAWIKPIATAAFNANAITSAIPSRRHSIFLPVVFLSGRCTTIYQIYRLLNVLLLGLTLLFLFLSGRKHVLVAIVGLTLLCIPQVLYIYSYANSDAWGLSVSIFLSIFLLATPIPIGSSRYGVALGVLIGVLLLSKATFWLSLSWAIVLIGSRYVQQQKDEASSLSSKQMRTGLGLFVITVF